MKSIHRVMRVLVVLVVGTLAALGQTATISGKIANVSSSGVGSNAYLQAELAGCGNNRAQYSGGVITAPFQYFTDSTGAFTGTIVKNTAITCGNDVGNATSYWMQAFIDGSPVGPRLPFRVTADFDWNVATSTAVNPVIPAPTGDSTYGRLDGGNSPFSLLGAVSFERRCFANEKAGDAGAGFNACVAALPSGGTIDMTGFAKGAVSYTAGMTSTGKRIYVKCDPSIEFTFAGTGSGFFFGENSDYSRMDGDCHFNLNNNAGTTYGIRVQGSSYLTLNVHVRGAPTAGVRISNDGAGNIGAYHNTVNGVVGDAIDVPHAPPTSAEKNTVGIQLESVAASGVNDTILNTWCTFAVSDCLQIKATTGSVLGTWAFGKGFSYNGGNGVKASGSGGTDFHARGTDMEGNTGNGVNCDADSVECDVEGLFSSNSGGGPSGGSANALAQHTRLCLSGVCDHWGGGATPNNPLKYLYTLQSAPFSAGVNQWTMPILFSSGAGIIRLQGLKATNDTPYLMVLKDDQTQGVGIDPLFPRIFTWVGTAFGGFLNMNTSGSWTLRNTTDNVVGAATTDSFTNKTFDTAATGNVFKINGVTITDNVGTGRVVHETNTALTTATLTGLTNGTGLQLFNTTTTCTTGAAIGAICTTGAITLPVSYVDTNYRVDCTGLTPTNVPIVETFGKSNTTFTITVAALTAAAASFGSYDCKVGHN